MKSCFVCGRESPDSATRCTTCGWPLSSKPSYWTYRLLTLVLIPGVLWLASVLWQRADRARVDHEELERAQTQLLEVLTQRMEAIVTLRMDLWKATATLARQCPLPGDREAAVGLGALIACGAHYLRALDAVDQAIVDLAWRIDSLPIVSQSTYVVLTALKASYWKPCPDSGPLDGCGYRQQAVRLIHGIGLPVDEVRALKACIEERAADPVCQTATRLMRENVQGQIDLDANTFFCLVAKDIKDVRVDVLRRRSSAIGGDATLDQIVKRLEDNVQLSACSDIVSKWRGAHPVSSSAR